ncbi:MAG: DUF29 domain-containing protein [Massilia sp.]
MNDAFIDTSQESSTDEESPLYKRDFVRWLETQSAYLRAQQFALLDLDNLVDEIDSMAGNERRELKHRLETLTVHLLKCQFQPERKSGSWLGTIMEQRSAIEELINESPSLRREVEDYVHRCYRKACRRAAAETSIPIKNFPTENPYSTAQILDEDFVP